MTLLNWIPVMLFVAGLLFFVTRDFLKATSSCTK